MTAPRIYSPGKKDKEGFIELGEEDCHYIKHVVRLKPKDSIILFDGGGCEYQAVIDRYTESGVILQITEVEAIDTDPHVKITVAQSLPKETKMDFIIRKSTELGAWRIIPFISARSVPRLTEEKKAARVKRWRKIAAEAATQSLRVHVPHVDEIVPFASALEKARKEALNIIFWEEETEKGIRDILNDTAVEGKKDIMVVIGPEGGFTRDEAARAVEKGFSSVHLGSRILRVETVSLAVLAIIQYELGLIGSPVVRKGTL
ncbi:MAG: 16S rRNA (uracil(1498)-N(3))-methyltransferase [Syntrophales bacterium]|nr:16S rRNA (uracil(1498)-N(3))-methyltransferase [Syntrophales bacterium]MDY0044876.1 16S rRNA (uracil(1498)-N(3))-methyltransferase [Syntrophales bacterium]